MPVLAVNLICEGSRFTSQEREFLNEFPNDKSHFHSLYKELHRLAAEHPNDTIELDYGGGVIDKHLDLQNLINCFSKHPNLLPKNLKLKFSDETNKTNPVPFNVMVCGTGGIDTNPLQTLQQLFPTVAPGTDCANLLYKKSTEQLGLTRQEVMPGEGIDVSVLGGKSIPIRSRDGQPQNFVPAIVQQWVDVPGELGVKRVVLHMQSAMNPPHPGHIQMLLATVEKIAEEAKARGEKVDIMVVAELAPEWYLQCKLALTADEVRKQFKFDTRKKCMTYLGHELVPAEVQSLLGKHDNLVGVKFVVNPDPIMCDHPERVQQMTDKLGSQAQVLSVQGIDSHAWTFEQLVGLSFISLTRGGEFLNERRELERKIEAAQLSPQEREIVRTILEFQHDLNVFSSSKLMSLEDKGVVELMQRFTPMYAEFFLQKLESKLAKAITLEDAKKGPALEKVKILYDFVRGRSHEVKATSFEELNEETRKFLLGRLEKHLEKINTIDPNLVKDLISLVREKQAALQPGQLKDEDFNGFLKGVKSELEGILDRAEPSEAKAKLQKKLERDPMLVVLLSAGEQHKLTQAVRARQQ